MYRGVEIIAEVKTKSPFGFESQKTWDELFEIANDVGDVISVHTNLRWGGSLELVKRARALTNKPILAKGIHNTEEVQQAIDAGADYVLVVGRLQADCWIEPFTLEELKTIPKNYRVVWNSRDLSNGELKKEKFEEARKVFDGWLCQASNIVTVNDIKIGANAVLVGEHLAEFARSVSQ